MTLVDYWLACVPRHCSFNRQTIFGQQRIDYNNRDRLQNDCSGSIRHEKNRQIEWNESMSNMFVFFVIMVSRVCRELEMIVCQICHGFWMHSVVDLNNERACQEWEERGFWQCMTKGRGKRIEIRGCDSCERDGDNRKSTINRTAHQTVTTTLPLSSPTGSPAPATASGMSDQHKWIGHRGGSDQRIDPITLVLIGAVVASRWSHHEHWDYGRAVDCCFAGIGLRWRPD